MRGAFITVEGTEGVGKSTNLEYILERLESAGRRVVVTREPGGTVLGEKLRELILGSEPGALSAQTETLLMFAARAHHVAELLRPTLERGEWLLCDRFVDATVAYQGGGRGVDMDLIASLTAHIVGDLQPDLTLLLDAPVTTGLARLHGRELDHFEQEDRAFFERVRSAYLETARAEPQRVKVIDASGDIAAVRRSIDTAIDRFLERWGS